MESQAKATSEFQSSDYESRLNLLCERVKFPESLIGAAKEAILGYTSELPYHNIEHMFSVAEEVLDLCIECKLDNYETQKLVMAALWHDYDYKTRLQDNFESKEHRSAIYAYNAIVAHATSENYIEQELFAAEVASLIISTHKSFVPCNLNEAILNSADISNLSGPVPLMLDRSIAFFIEGRLLEGEEVVGSTLDFLSSKREALNIWCPNTQQILDYLVTNKLGVGPVFTAVKERIAFITTENILNLVKPQDESEDQPAD